MSGIEDESQKRALTPTCPTYSWKKKILHTYLSTNWRTIEEHLPCIINENKLKCCYNHIRLSNCTQVWRLFLPIVSIEIKGLSLCSRITFFTYVTALASPLNFPSDIDRHVPKIVLTSVGTLMLRIDWCECYWCAIEFSHAHLRMSLIRKQSQDLWVLFSLLYHNLSNS